ncbi:hypothetical protein DFH09DRAFT_1453348, partial [Mycena vulgaris]
TLIAARAGGYPHVPGIWNEEQIGSWKEITDSVHTCGSYIFLQLWALGRSGYPTQLRGEDAAFPYISASDVQLKSTDEAPRPLSVLEIQEYVSLYVQAAKNALRAGFDGVEVHAGNGYLIDQFLQDVSNKRSDDYGGSVEKRSRFALEVLRAVTQTIGADRTGIRVSPWSTWGEMRMTDPRPTFTYLVWQMKATHPDLAYIHVVEPRISGDGDIEEDDSTASNDFLRALWAPKTFISAGGYSRDSALERAEKDGDLIAFGRQFLANPDLPVRLMKALSTNEPDRTTFYLPGSEMGYTDYPALEESTA